MIQKQMNAIGKRMGILGPYIIVTNVMFIILAYLKWR